MKHISEESALRECLPLLKGSTNVISLGYLSRYIRSVYDYQNIFYMKGSMGLCLPFSIGVCATSLIPVNCFIGDGAILMNLQSLALLKCQTISLNTFRIILIDNHCHNSTGQQKTNSENINFSLIAKAFSCMYYYAEDICTLKHNLKKIKNHNGISMLHISVHPMVKSPSRINESSLEIKNNFIQNSRKIWKNKK